MMVEGPLRCSICSAEFAKQDHLNRHRLSHTDRRQFQCQFCPQSFNRRDALLRHWRTCETRLKSGTSPPVLRPSKRGRRRNACERCAQAKKKCTGSVPCQLCSDQRQSCSLASTTTSQGLPLTPPSLAMAMGWMGVPCMRIRFLAVFTSTHGMANSFECGDSLTRKKMISSSRQACDTFSWAIYGSVTTSYTSLTPPWTDLYQMSTEPHHPALPCSLPLPDSLMEPTAIISYYDTEIAQSHALTTKSQDIVSGILSVTTLSRKLDLNSAQSSCAQFFSPTNLESFMGIFFQIWYPNWPVFHKPTFFASQRSPQLIAALSLIGACLSPEADDREQAITCMDAVEDWIFSSLELCEDTVHGPSQVRERLDLVQAAYALVLLMNWEGSKTQITRARRRYFSEIVSVARSLYPFAMAQADTTDTWMDFTLREECIRTLQYIFLLDCAFVIFHNSVPRMIVTELRFRLASSEELFLAPDPETWAALQPDGHIQRTTLYQAVDMMMTDEIGPEQWKVFEKMSLLNTFTIISAFHNLIFHHHGPKSPTITRGLRNWFHVWSNRDFSTLEDRPKNDKIGFYCHAAEYWCLAILFCRQHELGLDAQGIDMPRMANETSDMSGLHKMITRFQGVDFRGLLAM